MRTEHAGRRTCDGLAVLDAALDPVRHSSLGLEADTIAAIIALEATIDTYAELLIAEAVDHAVGGRPAAAAQALDAAAGLGMPPDLTALSTPHRGQSVRTTVLTVLPTARPVVGDRSPLVASSPAFASWVAGDLPNIDNDPNGPDWTFIVDGEPGISFAELGYHLADALLVDDLAGVVRLALSLDPKTTITEAPGVAVLRSRAPAVGTRPPNSQDLDLDHGTSVGAAAQFDRVVGLRLMRRLAAARLAARRVLRRLHSATTDTDRRAALVEAARWGFAPPLTTNDALDLQAALQAAIDGIAARIAATAGATYRDRSSLVEHIHRLVGRTVPLAVDLPPLHVELKQDERGDDGRSQIDAQWLEVVAAVRPALARLDAAQHLRVVTAGDPFVAASTHPGSPWLTRPESDDRTVPHLIVAYGPDPLPLSAGAWTVLDSYGETIPTRARSAGLALRFNAPGSQPPNAILVAVTPREGSDVDTEVALDAVVEARRTVRSRVIRQEDMGQLGFISGPWLPAFEGGGFQWRDRATQDDWLEGPP